MSFGDKPRRPKTQYQPPTRPTLSLEHQVDPKLELIIKQNDLLSGSVTEGSQLAKEIIRFSGPEGEVSIEAFKAFLVMGKCFAVPFDSPDYPNVLKIDTVVKRNSYYPQYVSRIFWKHSKDFWHIPCFTRYVIDKLGNIKNAYNGVDIKPNQWGRYDLVPDCVGFFNKTRPVDLSLLLALSHKQLPSDFKDYGFGSYNYTLEYDHAKKAVDWVKLPTVMVSDANGNIEEADNLNEFGIRFLKSKQAGELNREVSLYDLKHGTVNSGMFTVKLKDASLINDVPSVQVSVPTNQPAASPASSGGESSGSTGMVAATDFDDDIPF